MVRWQIIGALLIATASESSGRQSVASISNVTVDTVAPAIVSMAPISGNSVRIQFSESLAPPSNFTLGTIAASGPGLGSLAPQPDSAELQGDSLLVHWTNGFGVTGQTLQIELSGLVLDLAGNPLGSGIVSAPALPVSLRSFIVGEE